MKPGSDSIWLRIVNFKVLPFNFLNPHNERVAEGELAGVQGCSAPSIIRNGGAAPPFFEGQSAQIS